jgi:hypothetical protein
MDELVKIVVFVPENDAASIRQALGENGTGVIGEYTFCSYSLKGVGRYLASDKAKPYIGSKGKIEKVDEQRIEVQCDRLRAKEVVAIIRKAHPYEEVVIDVYPLISL